MGATKTVAEYVTKHCKANHPDEDLATSVQQHVNTMMLGATVSGYALYKTGVDSEGRVSLIWASMPEELWDGLHEISNDPMLLLKVAMKL